MRTSKTVGICLDDAIKLLHTACSDYSNVTIRFNTERSGLPLCQYGISDVPLDNSSPPNREIQTLLINGAERKTDLEMSGSVTSYWFNKSLYINIDRQTISLKRLLPVKWRNKGFGAYKHNNLIGEPEVYVNYPLCYCIRDPKQIEYFTFVDLQSRMRFTCVVQSMQGKTFDDFMKMVKDPNAAAIDDVLSEALKFKEDKKKLWKKISPA